MGTDSGLIELSEHRSETRDNNKASPMRRHLSAGAAHFQRSRRDFNKRTASDRGTVAPLGRWRLGIDGGMTFWLRMQLVQEHELRTDAMDLRRPQNNITGRRRIKSPGSSVGKQLHMSVRVGTPRKRPLGRALDNVKPRWEFDDREWVNLAQDRDQWRAY
ncbi:hypothetical protein ANN_16619 [Periplaneta americana]|uniref:Uncharacterized protein n=1 Tax=Periplaneta americana TaxID=6978 RepID=A0ABQ8SQV7_PERAM|nr:hypothetical protein ANN_16619 [Periplaneta americana]